MSAASGGVIGMLGAAAAMGFGYTGVGGGGGGAPLNSSAGAVVNAAPAVSNAPVPGGKQRKSISMDHLFSNQQSAAAVAAAAAVPAASIQRASALGSVRESISGSTQAAVPQRRTEILDTSLAAPAARPLPLSRAELDATEGDFLARLRRDNDEVVTGNRWKS